MYQLYIEYDNVNYAFIKEFRMRWIEKAPFAWARLVGEKFIASKGDNLLCNSEIYPLFDEFNNILGT